MDLPEKLTVKSNKVTIVPRYAETDQGGMAHHSVYPVWFEVGRTELLRENGVAYSDLEQAGVYFVVAELQVKYRRPVRYDEKLELETICSNVSPAKIEHTYKLRRTSDEQLLAEGVTILACMDAQGRVKRIPEFMYPGW